MEISTPTTKTTRSKKAQSHIRNLNNELPYELVGLWNNTDLLMKSLDSKLYFNNVRQFDFFEKFLATTNFQNRLERCLFMSITQKVKTSRNSEKRSLAKVIKVKTLCKTHTKRKLKEKREVYSKGLSLEQFINT